MKIQIKKGLLKNKRGSLIANLAALGLLSFSSLVLYKYIQSISSLTKHNIERHETSFNIHSEIINNLRGLLIDIKRDSNGDIQKRSEWGICSFLEPINREHGVGLIRFNISSSVLLNGKAKDSFSQERWEVFFDTNKYVISSHETFCQKMDPTFTSNYFNRCFKYTGEQSETATEVYVIARIIPKNIRDFSNIDLSQSNILDAKLVSFELQAIVGTVDEQESIVPSRYYSITWSNDVPECSMQIRGKWTNVFFSGSGPGRLSNNVLINNSDFNPPEQCSELRFDEIQADIIRAGKTINGSIAADHSKNARISCRKNIYRCPGVNSQVSDYSSPIQFRMGIINESGGILQFNELDFTFLNEQKQEADPSTDGKFNSINIDVRNNTNNFPANTALDVEQALDTGHNSFTFQLKDKAADSLAGLCQDICSNDKIYYPSITMKFAHPPSPHCSYFRNYMETDTEKQENRVRCTVCHSKICHKVGLGTFGPHKEEDGIPGPTDEPLDGHIPECALNKPNLNYDLPSVSNVPPGGDCVAMKVENIDSFKSFENADYKFQDCSKDLPVLCFAYGHYLPAISLSSPTEAAEIFKGSFADAQTACYKMGRELIKKENLAEYLKSYWPSIETTPNADIVTALGRLGFPILSSDSNYFDYINNGSRGIFIAPFYNISYISNRLTEGSLSYLQKFFSASPGLDKIWVAMEKDAGGQLIGSIPIAEMANSALAVFTRKESPARPLILRDTTIISHNGTDTKLTHNIRYKGVYNVSASGEDKALCRKEPGDFILSNRTSLAGAPSACQSKGASFLPPLSSMEWAKAMLLLNNNDKMYPFPDPGDFSGEDYQRSVTVPAPKAWVALSKESASATGTNAKNWRLSKIHFPDSDSIFKTETIPDPLPGANPSNGYRGVIDHKGQPISLSKADMENFDIDNSTYKIACFKKENGRHNLFRINKHWRILS